MAKESPQTEEPVLEPSEPEVSAEDQAKAILAELEANGINSVEKVQNVVTASSESGNLARMLGEQRRATEALQRQIEQLTQQPQHQSYDPEYGGEQPVDIRGIFRKEIRNFYQDEVIKPQVEQTNRVYGELSQIQSDPDYALVGQMWDKHWNSPNTQHRIMTGQTSPKGEYDNLVRTYYREALKKTHGALKGVVENSTARPPHVEVGSQSHVHTPTQSDEQKEQIQKITKSSQGGDGDIEALVKAFLPSTDSIFQ